MLKQKYNAIKRNATAGAGALALAATLAFGTSTGNGNGKGVAHNPIGVRKSGKFVICTDHFELQSKNNAAVGGTLRLETERKDPDGPHYNFSIRFDSKDQRPNLTDAQMDQLSREMDRTFRACNEKPWGIMLRW
ncbi:MAG: hypothetical protein KGI06_05565 [Candidatus Micrarchaeota archaeon]|nr:hypothetical protein [Candidatus Micrarchaeota archaeon]